MILALVLGALLAADPAANPADPAANPADPAATPAVISASGLPGMGDPAVSQGPPAPTDTLVRVPGSALRLGWTLARTSALGALRLGGSSVTGEMREGEVRWFGSAAKASLTYRGGRLAEARLTANAPSPRLGNYVPDELRRLGYRRVGVEVTSAATVSEWEGAAKIRLTVGAGNVMAEVSPRTAPAKDEALVAVASQVPAPDFTLERVGDSLPSPRRISTPADPVRPQVAVEAGVFGRVQVRARVNTAGVVEHAEIERGIAELNNEALEWAGAVRFEPYLLEGRAVPFVVRIPVAFLPARAANPGGTP